MNVIYQKEIHTRAISSVSTESDHSTVDVLRDSSSILSTSLSVMVGLSHYGQIFEFAAVGGLPHSYHEKYGNFHTKLVIV